MKLKVVVRNFFENKRSLKAVCSVTIDNMFTIHNVKVMESDTDRYIVMPYTSYKGADGKFKRKEIFCANTSEARRAFEAAVFAAYDARASDAASEESAFSLHKADTAVKTANDPDTI